jgi:hypothetical protein
LLRSNSLTCELEQRWRTLFQNHDANTIRGIQDRLECCGLRSVLDQPWPFPDNHGATRCRDNFGRDRNCGPLWRAREVEILSIWVSVGVLGLVVKVCQGVSHPRPQSHTQETCSLILLARFCFLSSTEITRCGSMARGPGTGVCLGERSPIILKPMMIMMVDDIRTSGPKRLPVV